MADNNVVFGLMTYKGLVAGVQLKDIKITDDSQPAENMNEDGLIDQIDVYGYKSTVSGNGTLKTGKDLVLAPGATLVIDTKSYKITSIERGYSATGHATFTFSGVAPGTAPAAPAG